MSHKHKGQHKHDDKGKPIGMVAQRSTFATVMMGIIVAFVAIAVVGLIYLFVFR